MTSSVSLTFTTASSLIVHTNCIQLLHKLLTPKNKQKDIQWTDETSQAFTTVKQSLIQATLLLHPKPNALTNIMSDASDNAVGAMLQQ